MMAQFGFEQNVVDQPDCYIRYSDAVELLEECAASFSAPHFGLDLAELQSVDTLGPLAVIASASESFGDALGAINRYLYIHNPGASTGIGVDGQEAVFWIKPNDPRLWFRRQLNELSIASASYLLQLLAGAELQFTEVRINSEPPPGGAARAERFFQAPVRYRQDATALLFSTAYLERRIASKNNSLMRLVESYLGSIEYDASEAFQIVVERLIVELLPIGDCSLTSVAYRLCCHPRTLQNRLASLGLEFRQMIASQRFRLAQAYLSKTSTSLAEISILLGYADQASFTRAFSAWAGQSPRRFRLAQARRGRIAHIA